MFLILTELMDEQATHVEQILWRRDAARVEWYWGSVPSTAS